MNWKEASGGTTVCYCQNIDKDGIVASIKAGNNTLSQIKEKTTACTGGNCKELNPSGKCCSSDIMTLIELYSDKPAESGSASCCCCSS
ncbi:(2Fe-2S)-binding protein [Sphaerochaeta sp. S2]|nr:(2Fe-2S)-binding protein [Sphaerochaeta sp. S2]MBJ2356259.1 (2Fe-2S)-binding protein [Sphaerochaeta sp. S2]